MQTASIAACKPDSVVLSDDGFRSVLIERAELRALRKTLTRKDSTIRQLSIAPLNCEARLAELERGYKATQRKTFKKLFLKNLELWPLRAGVLTLGYFLLKHNI
jgi:hypothetical protein